MSVRGIKNGRKMIIAGLPPVATTTSRGTVKPDGVTITVDGDGVIRSTGGMSIDNDTIVKNSQKQIKVSDNIINTLNGKANQSTTYTKAEVDALISGSGGSVAIDNDTITKNSQNEIQVADRIITQINTIEEKVDDIVAPTPVEVNFSDYFTLKSGYTLATSKVYKIGNILYVNATINGSINYGSNVVATVQNKFLTTGCLAGVVGTANTALYPITAFVVNNGNLTVTSMTSDSYFVISGTLLLK